MKCERQAFSRAENRHRDELLDTNNKEPMAMDATDISAPRVAFDLQLRLLSALLALCVLTALALLSVLGFVQWRTLNEQAALSAARATVVAKEHADKVFELNAALKGRVEDALVGMSEDRIRAEQRSIHIKLRRMIAGLPQVIAVAVIGKDGDVLAHSRDYPVPQISIADRDYFTALKDGKQESVSPIVVGRRAQQPLFTDGVARRSEDGEFQGIILVSLDPNYFLAFYEEMLPGEMHQSLSLVRQDGAILVRYPKMPGQLAVVPPAAPFFLGIGTDPISGALTGVSPLDGTRKIIAYRRVANHDLYVVSAGSLSHVWNSWLSYMALAAGLLLVPSGLLCGIIIFSIRKVKDQRVAWGHWRHEFTLRHKAESTLRESQKFEALGKLLGRVAHDFNNCLMVVTTGIQIIRLKRIAGVEKQIDAIERAVNGGQQLTRQLLGVSRRQPLKPEIFSLQTRMSEWQTLLLNPIGAERCTVVVEPDTWPVCVDPIELQLALINVLMNARDASPSEGGITLQIGNVLKRDEMQAHDYFVRLAVIDHGIGMSESARRQAFDPLFTTKEAGKGTGLGLSQVQNFARAAGGHVELESTLGVGTTVSIFLPAADEAPQALVSAATPVAVKPLKLLLVEDNLDVADGIITLLQTAGHTVTHMKNAMDAEQFLLNNQVELVISDIHMPGGITGIALAKRLRLSHPALPVILISGYAEDLQSAMKSGFKVVSKPFSLESINQHLFDGQAAGD